VSTIKVSDFSKFISAGIKRYHNPDYCKNQIIQRHNVQPRHHLNAAKQGKQLSSCVSLGLSYLVSASQADLTIKPVLIYYSIMNFALAEILMKQDGSSNLDQLRAKHRHHGLDFSFDSSLPKEKSIQKACAALIAKPISNGIERRGTFSVWHRTAREHPVVGKITSNKGVSRYGATLSASDYRFPEIGNGGVSLLDALRLMPTMSVHLQSRALPYDFCRCAAEIREDEAGQYNLSFTVHPDTPEKIQSLQDLLLFAPRRVDSVAVTEYASGFTISVSDLNRFNSGFNFPPIGFVSKDELVIQVRSGCLNEFGAFYVFFFLVGNMCRYYPEYWIQENDRNSDFAILCDLVCAEFFERVPQLVLSELEGQLLVSG
jgi:hypothetical protein